MCTALIFNRYLGREIRRPLLPVLAILVALFGGYSAAAFLSDAASGLLRSDLIAELVALKVLISLEVLIPVSLYIAVVLSFGRLYSDSEFTAAYALRLTPARTRRAVLAVSASLALVVAVLSLVARPWAYQKMHQLAAEAQASLDINAMQAGTFYVGEQGKRAIFLAHRDGPRAPARDVFVQLWHGGQIEVIHAKRADALPRQGRQGKGGRDAQIVMRDAHLYRINLSNPRNDQILDARGFIVDPDANGTTAADMSAVDVSTARLAVSNAPADVAEFEWRLSTPISTLLLGLLGIPMSRAAPQQSRYTKLGGAILVYIGYYMLSTSARTWVQHGAIAAFPGIWWAPALLGAFLLATLYGPLRGSEFSGGRGAA